MAPHNPDLKLLVFWFWGTFKDNVYRNKPGSGEEFRLRVDQNVEEVPADTAESTPQMCYKHKSESAHFLAHALRPQKAETQKSCFYTWCWQSEVVWNLFS